MNMKDIEIHGELSVSSEGLSKQYASLGSLIEKAGDPGLMQAI